MGHSSISHYLEKLYAGVSLNYDESFDVFSQVMQGQVTDIVLSSLLTVLKIKQENPEEIAGAAAAMVDNALAFPTVDYAFSDIVGTGGDGHNSINISSAAAIVAASCGVKVAKHGNRSVSSKSGSADLFNAFGMKLDMQPIVAKRCLDEANLCFLSAPVYHGGVRFAMPVRTALKTRTLFNILGPLANPAKPTHSVMGVYTPTLLPIYTETLKMLGHQHALIVHGSGLDELALHDVTTVFELHGDHHTISELSPELFGLSRYPLEAIKGGDPELNKQLIADVLSGNGLPAHKAAIAMNAAALIKLNGIDNTYVQACERAMQSIQEGRPMHTILKAADLSQKAINEMGA